MTGARGVLQTGSAIIQMIQAKNVLDIGLFTGVSALTWATVLPPDGKVISMDIDIEAFNTTGKPFVDKVIFRQIWIDSWVFREILPELLSMKKTLKKWISFQSGVGHKIDIRIQPALQTLQELIDGGQSGKFDYAFIDANKAEYAEYYPLCLELLRPGGVLVVDNVSRETHHPFLVVIMTWQFLLQALWYDEVLKKEKDVKATAIDKLNKMAVSNADVRNVLLPIEDGLHIILKR